MDKTKLTLVLITIVGLALRLSVSLVGYHGDLNNNISWGRVAYENGLNGFYEGSGLPIKDNGEKAWPYSAPNQPPLAILMFQGARLIWQNTRDFLWYMNWELVIFPSKTVWFWDDHGMTVLVKFPSIIADLGIGILIYYFVVYEFKKSKKSGLIALLIWTFNPVIWYNSSVWGQTDSIVNLLGLLAIYFLTKKKLPVFTVFFTLSFLFKGSLGVFIPVLFIYALTQKYPLRIWFLSTIYSLLSIILVSLWFHPQIDIFQWLIKLYTQRILPGEIGYLSANAFNFWWLVNPGKVLDSQIYFGLSARTLGFIITLLVNGIVIFWMSKKPDKSRLIVSLMVVSLASFLFMTRIHERYLYPFFPLSTIFVGLNPGFGFIYSVFSFVHLLNLYNLFWVPGIPFLEKALTLGWITNLASIVNLVLFVETLRHLRASKI